ncbi:MAG: RecX family transcriptional regulator [Chloroflexi bacterium]|nr:RecX family transcriptional regulator [Chloroflexota bacterium]MCI0824588.1 RecX family transcriptional regulator [Chloroflexota bacterium]
MEQDTEKQRDADYVSATRSALHLLSYRARSEAEIRRRLSRRHHAHTIESVIETLKAQGYLDDAAFARQWRSQRERRRPRGQALLRQELTRLGVSAEVVREALEDFNAGDNAYRAAQGLATRLAGKDHPEFRRRLWAHLQRRGFEHAVIGETVQALWQELRESLADSLHGDEDSSDDQE